MKYYQLTLGPDVDAVYSTLWQIVNKCLDTNLVSCTLPFGAQVQPVLVLNNESTKRVDWDQLQLDAKIENSPSESCCDLLNISVMYFAC